MIKYLLPLVFMGCASNVKHETVSLLCLGFCDYVNVNHEKTPNPPKEDVSPSQPPKE